MKVFVLLSRIPYPLEKGDKLRAYHQVKAINKQHEVFLCCLNFGRIPDGTEEKLKEISSRYQIIQLSYLLLPFYLLLTFIGSKPIQVGYFFQYKAARKIRQAIQAFQPDHIYAQLLRTAEYVKNIHHISKTLDYQDAFSANAARRAKKSGLFTRPIWTLEKERLQVYENIIFEYFEYKTIISTQDQQAINHPLNKEIKVIANGVDLDEFKPLSEEKSFDILFTGNMSYPPNVEAATHLVKTLLPEIKKAYPKVRVCICGATPAPKVLQLAGEGVMVTGWVDNITQFYQKSRVFVAPMQIGAGLQNKLLEAMACGLPCVTSPLAANALINDPNPPYLVGDSVNDYVEKIVKILTDQHEADNRSKAGREFVLEHYSWEKAVEPLLEILEKK